MASSTRDYPQRWVINTVTLLITPLVTTHEPPSVAPAAQHRRTPKARTIPPQTGSHAQGLSRMWGLVCALSR